MTQHDAVVIGSGPNGLAAAIELAQSGRSVLVREAAARLGGGLRSEGLTLPGFTHDVCSAVHPLARASPFFRTLPLAEHGLEWIEPPFALAHPLDDAEVVTVTQSLEQTADGLGRDRQSYLEVFQTLVERWPKLERAVLGPLVRPHRNLGAFARFGFGAVRSAAGYARTRFSGERARALFAGLAAHSGLPLDGPASASFSLVLGATAHLVGWPFPRGGSQQLADALASYLRALGGALEVRAPVESLDELQEAEIVLCDVTPHQFLRLAGNRVSGRYRRALERYRYGPGVFKLDWALSAPIPWAAEATAAAGTVHVGGGLDEITASERAPTRGETAERPFVLLAQPTRFDPSRAPAGRHTAWAYCHVPNGAAVDMTEAIERQVERFAPGFREVVLARHALGPGDLERHNPNLVGGDVSGGANDLRQLLARPVLHRVPYATPIDGVYLCSAATPPGGGVHGMCGYLAARAALSAS